MEQEYQRVVQLAWDTASEILCRKRSENTIKTYLQAYKRLVRAGQNPIEYCAKSTKGVYYTIKAAYQFGLATEIKKQITSCFTTATASEPKVKIKALMHIEDLMGKLQGCNPDYERNNQYTGVERAFQPGRKKSSKRQVLRCLPPYWRELVIAGAAPQHKEAITMLALCGCRPSELAKGVTIIKRPDGIEIVIKGTKITEYAGQEWRGLLFDHRVNQFANIFWQDMKQGQEVVIQVNRWTIIDAVRSAAKRGGLEHWKKVTPYCFRHQFAADIKADDGPVSEVLGHASDRTASNYGQRSQATGKGGITKVKTARPVKQSPGRGAELHANAGPRPRMR